MSSEKKLKEVFDDKTKKVRLVPIEEIKKNQERYLPYSTKGIKGKMRRDEIKDPLKKRFGGSSMNEIEKERKNRKNIKKTRDMLMKAREEGGRFSKSDKDIATNQAKQLLKFGRERDSRLSVSDVEMLMDAMPKYNVGGHSVMGSPISVDADGETLMNPSAKGYYKGMLVED